MSVTPTAGNPRFTISADSRSGRGAQIIADTVQTEYEKLHKSRKSEKVESARNLLELLLENRQGEEQRIASEMSRFKKDKNIPIGGCKKSTLHEKVSTSQRSLNQNSSKLKSLPFLNKF